MNYRKPSLIYMGPDMVGRGLIWLVGAWLGPDMGGVIWYGTFQP